MTKKRLPSNPTYTYYPAVGHPINIMASEGGVTEDYILVLRDLDDKERLSTRYEDENRDYGIENAKRRFDTEPDESVDDPIEMLADRTANSGLSLFSEPEKENPMVMKLLACMEQLTPEQIDLIYDLYGMKRFATEIAAEHNVSPQAINNRKNKIIKRLTKLFTEMDKA